MKVAPLVRRKSAGERQVQEVRLKGSGSGAALGVAVRPRLVGG